MSLYVMPKDLSTPVVLTQREVQEFDKDTSLRKFCGDHKFYISVNIPCKLWKKVVIPTSIAVGIGGAVGGVGGFVLAGPPGIAPGVVAGAAFCGSIAFATTYGYVISKIPAMLVLDPKYHEWRVKKQLDNLIHIFDAQVREHNELISLHCPIYGDFPRIPVRAPCGHVYDKESIERHLESPFAAKSSCSSLDAVRFTKADLNFYPEHLMNIMKTCVQIRNVISAGMEGRILREGLDVVFHDAQSITKQNMSIKISSLIQSSQAPGSKIPRAKLLEEIGVIIDENTFESETKEQHSLSLSGSQ